MRRHAEKTSFVVRRHAEKTSFVAKQHVGTLENPATEEADPTATQSSDN